MSLLWRWKGDKIRNPKLGGGNSNIIYFHPEPWWNDLIWLIFFGLKPPTRKTLRQLFGMIFGQIIATSNHRTDFSPKKVADEKKSPLFHKNPDWWNILVWPDDSFQGSGVGEKWPDDKKNFRMGGLGMNMWQVTAAYQEFGFHRVAAVSGSGNESMSLFRERFLRNDASWSSLEVLTITF